MAFIYESEVSNSGKEKVTFYLVTKFAQEHPPGQRLPQPPNHPARSARAPGLLTQAPHPLGYCWEAGLLSGSAAYHLLSPSVSFQCYPISFSGVNRKTRFATWQLPPPSLAAVPIPKPHWGWQRRCLIPPRPSFCRPNFPQDQHQEHTDI